MGGPTPLEANGHARLSNSDEVAAYLARLAERSDAAATITIGHSAAGRPLIALVCTRDERPLAAPDPRLRLLLVGSQHGASEGAGCEALLAIARDLALGPLRELLADLDVILLPNANPDGRELGTSKNANEVNINRDFVLLSQPESRALNEAVLRFAPHVVLDAHESAILKRKSLGREGYLTDFEAQFDIGNNPAIPVAIRDYCEGVFLPALLERVRSAGLPAQQYIREIMSTRQPLTNGGLTARRFRNKAALSGALSVLLETRLDPQDGAYPTFRNIGTRVAKQLLCMRAFLALVRTRGREIARLVQASRRDASREPVTLAGEYIEDSASPRIRIPLRKRDTLELVEMEFRNHCRIAVRDTVELPRNYYITDHAATFGELLSRHGIRHETLARPLTVRVITQRFRGGEEIDAGCELLEESAVERDIPAGGLRVRMAPAHARLLPLLLDPRSTSSFFRYAAYGRLLPPQAEFFIYRSLSADVPTPAC